MQLEYLSVQFELTAADGGELTVAEGAEVTVAEGAELTVAEGAELTVADADDVGVEQVMVSSPTAATANLFSTRVLALSAVGVPVVYP